jgi:HNH endonuclease
MSSLDPDAVFAVLRAADPEVMDRDELAGLAQQLAAHRGWCDSLQVRITRRQRALADQGRGEQPADLLAREGGQSSRDARAADDREQVCSNLPNFEDALAAGDVSAGHVDAIAAVVRGMDQVTAAEFFTHRDDLLTKANQQSVDTFGRSCRDLARLVAAEQAAGSELSELERQQAAATITRWIDKPTGMHKTLLNLDPERDTILWTAVSAALKQLRRRPEHAKTPWAQLEVEALIAACNGGDGGERVPSLLALCDLATLRDGLHANSICETEDGTPLPVEVIRRLACEAEIIPVVLNSRGEALAVGRAQRLATPAQRAALRAMHRTCMRPTCTVPFDACQIHHIVPWDQGGPTDLSNLGPLCSRDHHLVHEGGWTLTITADRNATWTRPDGTIDHTGTTIDRAPNGIAPPADDLRLAS